MIRVKVRVTGWYRAGALNPRSGIVRVGIRVVVHGIGVLVVVVAVVLVASERNGGPACATEWGKTTLAATAGIDTSEKLLVADRERVEVGTYERTKKRKRKKRTIRTRATQRPQLFQGVGERR